MAVAAGLALTTGMLQQPALGSDPSDGTVRIKVIRDSNTDGRHDGAAEPPAAGITVELTDVDGNQVTAVTGPDGYAVFPPNTTLTGGKYYVRMKMPNGSFLQPTFGAAGGLASNATVIDVIDGDAELTMGVRNPADWCEDNPRLSTVCQVAATKSGGVRTTVTFDFNERGDSNSGNTTTLATRNDTGNTYGVAYHKAQRRIFTGAHAKRHTVYGPSGQGAIYVTPAPAAPPRCSPPSPTPAPPRTRTPSASTDPSSAPSARSPSETSTSPRTTGSSTPSISTTAACTRTTPGSRPPRRR